MPPPHSQRPRLPPLQKTAIELKCPFRLASHLQAVTRSLGICQARVTAFACFAVALPTRRGPHPPHCRPIARLAHTVALAGGGSYRWRNCAPWSPPTMALKRHQHLDALGCWQPLLRWHAITACGAAPPPAGRRNGGEQTCLQPAKSRQSIRQALSRIEHSSIETQTIPKRKKNPKK